MPSSIARFGIDPHVRAGINRAADWLANAGYEVVDAEPSQIAEAAVAWFDAIWADIGTLWPGTEPVAGRDEVKLVKASLAQRMFKPVQAAQPEAWKAVYQLGSAWSRSSQDHPVVVAPVCCERPWLIDEDISRIARIGVAMRMVVPVNILGLPSCARPVNGRLKALRSDASRPTSSA
jgi:amidase